MNNSNPYKILGVSEGTPYSECKKVYRRLARKYHPDLEGGNIDMFRKISQAIDDIEAIQIEQNKQNMQRTTVYNKSNKYLKHEDLFNFKVYIKHSV